MYAGRLLPALFVAAVVIAPVGVVVADSGSDVPVLVDAGVASGSGSAVAALPAAKDPVSELPSEGTIAKDVAKAIRDKDWFLLAGAVLSALILLTRSLLAKKWPHWDESHYGVFLTAGFAGLAALAVAWVSDTPVASSHTLLGALKLMGAAVLTYVAPKKLLEGFKNTGTASSSDVPLK